MENKKESSILKALDFIMFGSVLMAGLWFLIGVGLGIAVYYIEDVYNVWHPVGTTFGWWALVGIYYFIRRKHIN